MFNYKCYVQSLVSFDDQAKASNLYLNGWLTDDPETLDGVGHIEPSLTNESQLSREAWFRQSIFKPKKQSPYSESGFTFLAPLKHEFNGSRQIFPPSTKIQFTLTKAEDAWYLMKPDVQSKDTENYKFKILSCVLFVKVVTLTDPVYKSLSSRLSRERLIYHYHILTCKTESINPHSILFESNNLFPDSEAPIRLYFMIVKNKSLGRDYYRLVESLVKFFSIVLLCIKKG